MKLVLREDVDTLGKRGQVINVAKGYARNFLLPKKLAFIATDENIVRVEQQKKIVHAKELREKEEAEELAKKFKDLSITIIKKVAENQVLYGSVSQGDIAEKLVEEGYEIDKKRIVIDEPIKKLGIYDVSIMLHTEVVPTIKVWVVKE